MKTFIIWWTILLSFILALWPPQIIFYHLMQNNPFSSEIFMFTLSLVYGFLQRTHALMFQLVSALVLSLPVTLPQVCLNGTAVLLTGIFVTGLALLLPFLVDFQLIQNFVTTYFRIELLAPVTEAAHPVA